MDNSLKRATALMAVVLMLMGCSSQDNKSNNHSTDVYKRQILTKVHFQLTRAE